jgi:hypothetical protein
LATNDFAELVLRWPDAGTDRTAARFEYGEGTLANLATYTLTQSLPINAVTYTGASEKPSLTARASDPASIARYDLLEAWYSDPDVTVASTLQEKADERLRAFPSQVVEVDAVVAGPSVAGPPVPRLWRDFDVGDTVYLSVRDDATRVYNMPALVTGAALSVSEEDASEQLAVTFEAPDAEAQTWVR